MTNAAEPIAKPYRIHMVAAVAVAGLLWLADGRLWPSVVDRLGGSVFWLTMILQWTLGAWLAKSRLGRVLLVFVYGVFLWLAAEAFSALPAGGGRRSLILVIGALILTVLAVNLIWERAPEAWRARIAASRISYGVGSVVLLVLGGGFIWAMIGVMAEGVGPGAQIALTALFLAMGAGLVLALWRLEGWVRTFVCWAICGLTWAGIMTGLATGAEPTGIGLGGWLLATLPPLIVGAVLLAYYRINRAYRV